MYIYIYIHIYIYAKRSRTHLKILCSPCLSAVDYGNTKIMQHALKMSVLFFSALPIFPLAFVPKLGVANIFHQGHYMEKDNPVLIHT